MCVKFVWTQVYFGVLLLTKLKETLNSTRNILLLLFLSAHNCCFKMFERSVKEKSTMSIVLMCGLIMQMIQL